jgi:hypothetical protein
VIQESFEIGFRQSNDGHVIFKLKVVRDLIEDAVQQEPLVGPKAKVGIHNQFAGSISLLIWVDWRRAIAKFLEILFVGFECAPVLRVIRIPDHYGAIEPVCSSSVPCSISYVTSGFSPLDSFFYMLRVLLPRIPRCAGMLIPSVSVGNVKYPSLETWEEVFSLVRR